MNIKCGFCTGYKQLFLLCVVPTLGPGTRVWHIYKGVISGFRHNYPFSLFPLIPPFHFSVPINPANGYMLRVALKRGRVVSGGYRLRNTELR